MRRAVRFVFLVPILLVVFVTTAHAQSGFCRSLLSGSAVGAPFRWIKAQAIDAILKGMAYRRGLPKYRAQIKAIARAGDFGKRWDNFGQMGLSELGISVRYNKERFLSLNTGRPLIVVANHHLGIADGLALQYVVSAARPGTPVLLFLARWIEQLLPFAVYAGPGSWGTALPIVIDPPKPSDPQYVAKTRERSTFNKRALQDAKETLRLNGGTIQFAAGRVASVWPGEAYPQGVKDDPESWQTSFLSLARIKDAQIVLANVDAVNSEAFYRDRKRFGGGNLERVVWFLSEALAKRGFVIDVHLSKPMDLAEIHAELSRRHGHSPELLKANPSLTGELIRQWVYRLPGADAPALDQVDSPGENERTADAG